MVMGVPGDIHDINTHMSVHLCGWYGCTRQIIHDINTHMSVHLWGWYGSTRQIIHDINAQYECTLVWLV